MKKLFFTISLLSMLLTPFVAMAHKLPNEIIGNAKYKDFSKYQVVILEEGFGHHSGLPKEFENKPIYRVTECEIDSLLWDTKKEVGPIVCNSLENLVFKCTSKDWPRVDGVPKPNPSAKKVICDEVGVAVGKGGLELLKNFISTIYVWGASLVGVIAVLRIVIAGVEISASQGAGNLEEAKNKIFQCIASLILLFLSAMLLYTINPNFFT